MQYRLPIILRFAGVLALALATSAAGAMPTLKEFAARAAAFHSAIQAPDFETTPGQIRADTKKAIAEMDAALTALGIAPQ